MTFDEVIDKYRERILKIQSGVPLLIAATTVISQMGERIFEKGQDVNGKTFNYSKKRTWIDTKVSPKNLKLIGSTGKPTKTTQFFEGGYKEFKKTIGREDKHVNFRLNNDLQSDFLNANVSKTTNKVGAPNFKVIDDAVTITLKREINIKKKEGLEKKYGAVIFSASKEEKKLFSDVAQFEVKKILYAK